METISAQLLTVEYLINNFGTVEEGINFAEDLKDSYPILPKKPILKSNCNSEEALIYATNLKKYEDEMVEYKINLDKRNALNNEIDKVIEAYIKGQTGFDSIVPKIYRENVYKMAKDDWSNGWFSVYCTLDKLVEVFNV